MTHHDARVEESGTPTRYWHRLEDGRVQCDVCPRACKLKEGARGLCFVRARRDKGPRRVIWVAQRVE